MRDGFEKAMDGVAVADSGPYRGSEEHLWDELRRIDQLVRARTVRWQMTLAAGKPEHLWGMIHVTETEVERYLSTPFMPPDQLPAELEQALRPYWQAAQRQRPAIDARVLGTPPEVPLPLRRLEELFGLSDLERDILLICLLPELDGRYRRLFGYLLDDASRTRPTVELVLEILHPLPCRPGTARRAFAPGRPLVDRALLDFGHQGQVDEPLSLRSLQVDERIVAFLLGTEASDARLAGIVSQPPGEVSWEEWIAAPEQVERLQALAATWAERRPPAAAMTLLLHGPYGSDRLIAARALATAIDVPLLVADVGRGLQAAGGWPQLVKLSYREAMLRGAALYWAGCEKLLAEDPPDSRWDHLTAAAESFGGLTFLASEKPWEPAGRFHRTPLLRFDFPVPSYRQRLRLWEKHLPAGSFAATAPEREHLAEALANGFQITSGQIVDAVTTARGQAAQRQPRTPCLTVDDLYDGCRRQSGRRLMAFARRVEPRTALSFDDLILPPTNKRQLRELRDRIRHRSRVRSELGFERRLLLGKGLIALFTGSSGTGKTMAAELLAREQRVDLYKVDLSAVVSKYVGETEKNLSRVFAEAEDANAILFFDEADAMFGKRGEVRDARDRWANLEVNYLLQKVEEYAGVVILASNLRQNIDEAFMRRIQVIVEFPFPDVEARFRIWSGMIPPDLDRPPDEQLRGLADRFRLAGGSVKNIVVDAAFRALAEDGPTRPAIALRHLVVATAREYQKLGKPVMKSEFGEEFHGWVEEVAGAAAGKTT